GRVLPCRRGGQCPRRSSSEAAATALTANGPGPRKGPHGGWVRKRPYGRISVALPDDGPSGVVASARQRVRCEVDVAGGKAPLVARRRWQRVRVAPRTDTTGCRRQWTVASKGTRRRSR